LGKRASTTRRWRQSRVAQLLGTRAVDGRHTGGIPNGDKRLGRRKERNKPETWERKQDEECPRSDRKEKTGESSDGRELKTALRTSV